MAAAPLPEGAAAKPARISQSGATGTRQALVIFARFKGESTTIPSWASDIFNPELPGSFSHFYDTMSFGKLQVRGEVAPRVYESGQPALVYISSDPTEEGRFGVFAMEVLRQVDQDIDFAQFDNDGPDGISNSGDDDGRVDAVFIVVEAVPSGFIRGGATGIGELGFREAIATQDLGVSGRAVQIAPWMGTLQQARSFAEAAGAMCHEYGHVLGLPDLYDTAFLQEAGAGPEQDAAGVGAWCLMGWGAQGWQGNDGPNSFCAWSRLQLGWAEVEDITQSQELVQFGEIGKKGQVLKIPLRNEEYFLLEYRRSTSTYYDRHIPGEGVLIWHVEFIPGKGLQRQRTWVDLEGADGRWRDAGYPLGRESDPQGEDNLDFWAHDAEYARVHAGNLGDATDPFDGQRYRAFTPQTNPAAYSNDGLRSVRIEQLSLTGDLAQVAVRTEPLILQVDKLGIADVDGDSVLVAGEEVQLKFRLSNKGGVRATAVKAVLSSADTLIEILQPEVSIRDLNVESKSSDHLPPQFRFREDFAGTHRAELLLAIQANGEQVEYLPLAVTAIAPRQKIRQVQVVDSLGNGDGRAQPGELIRLGLEIEVEEPALLPALRFTLKALGDQVFSLGSPLVVFDQFGGPLVEAVRSPQFLVPVSAAGSQRQFLFEGQSAVGAWQDTLSLAIDQGQDQTPPRLEAPQLRYQGKALIISLLGTDILEASPLSEVGAVIYTAGDTTEIEQLPLRLQNGVYESRWSNPGPGTYLIAVVARDAQGQHGYSPLLKVEVPPFKEEPAGKDSVIVLGKGTIDKVAYSPDGQWLTVAGSVGVRVYEANTLREIGLLEEVWPGEGTLTPFLSGGRLATSDTQFDRAGSVFSEVKLWDIPRPQQLVSLVLPIDVSYNSTAVLAFSPDTQWLAVVESGSPKLRIWDVAQRAEVAVLAGHTSAVNALTFSPDGQWLVSGSDDKTLRIWTVGSWQEAAVLKGHTEKVGKVVFSPDGRFIVSTGGVSTGYSIGGSGEKIVRLWDVARQQEVGELRYGNSITSLAFSPDGHTLAIGGEQGVQLWDTDQRQRFALLPEEGAIASLAFDPEGKVLAVAGKSLNYFLHLWEVESQRPLAELSGYTAWGLGAVSPDRKTMVDRNTVSRSLDDPELKATLAIGDVPFALDYGWAFSPDGEFLALGGGEKEGVRLWKMGEKEPFAVLEGTKYHVSALAFSPTGQVLAVGQRDTVQLWDITRQEVVERFAIPQGTHSKEVRSMVFSPDGRLLVMDTPTGLTVRDPNGHREIARLDSEDIGRSLAFSPDSRLLASNTKSIGAREPLFGITLWDTKELRETGFLGSSAGWLSSLAFSPDGQLLVGSSPDSLHIWDVAHRAQLKVIPGLGSAVFSPDGATLIFVKLNGTVQLWAAPIPTAVEERAGTLPQRVTLLPAYPNPFNPTTTLRFTLPQSGEAELAIYNLLGQRVATLVHGVQEAGAHQVVWDGRDEQGRELASGVYVCRLQAGAQVETRKLLLLR